MVDKFILKTAVLCFQRSAGHTSYLPHTVSAISLTSLSLFHCSSSVSLLPISQEQSRTADSGKDGRAGYTFLPHGCGRLQSISLPDGAVVIDNPPYYRGLPDHLRKRRKGKNIICDELQRRDCGADLTGFDKGNQPENDRLIKANTKELPKYDYPMNVITAA